MIVTIHMHMEEVGILDDLIERAVDDFNSMYEAGDYDLQDKLAFEAKVNRIGKIIDVAVAGSREKCARIADSSSH